MIIRPDPPYVPSENTGASMYQGRQTVTIKQACELVGVSRRTIYNWINQGLIETIYTAGGSQRIIADTLWRNTKTANDKT